MKFIPISANTPRDGSPLVLCHKGTPVAEVFTYENGNWISADGLTVWPDNPEHGPSHWLVD